MRHPTRGRGRERKRKIKQNTGSDVAHQLSEHKNAIPEIYRGAHACTGDGDGGKRFSVLNVLPCCCFGCLRCKCVPLSCVPSKCDTRVATSASGWRACAHACSACVRRFARARAGLAALYLQKSRSVVRARACVRANGNCECVCTLPAAAAVAAVDVRRRAERKHPSGNCHMCECGNFLLSVRCFGSMLDGNCNT